MLKVARSEYHKGMWNVKRTDFETRQKIRGQDRETFLTAQQERLISFVAAVRQQSPFYRDRLESCNEIRSLDEYANVPLLRKEELIGENGDAANLTFPKDRYCRFHRTSGTTGRPMAVLDTKEDWQWWMESWQYVLDSADVTSDDRVLMAFSFGPFVGFWSAFDAVVERGALVMPTGAMSTEARLDLVLSSDATVVFCTPSYALHMAQVAEAKSIPLKTGSVRTIIVAGEPGGSVPEIRSRIESSWNASVVDHAGATEVGPWGFADSEGTGLFVNEAQFYPEFLDVDSNELLTPRSNETDGVVCQLVLSTIGRLGCPVLRYVTGDLVKPTWKQDSRFVFLDGGVLGRSDNMMVIRGVNVFPTAIERILRTFNEVDEFQLIAYREGEMDQLKVIVEDGLNVPERIASEIQLRLGLRVDVEVVEAGSLPRFEMKGKRFLDQR
jgi:phenylacetate-CoA ligase